MVASFVLYGGLLVAALGALAVLRPLRRLGLPTRRRGAALLGLGLLLAGVAALLPAPAHRVATPATRLDAIVPAWQFGEYHEIRVHAEPARVEASIRAVTAQEIRFFRLLTWIRNPRRTWRQEPANLLAPPADRPLLDVALGSGFKMLAEEPGRELVFGTLVVVPPEVTRLSAAERRRRWEELTPARFGALARPGYAKAVMAFRLVDEGGGWTRVVTETRVFATDDSARRHFAPYWRVIYPGSALIRRMWLQAIRRRAEG